MDQALAPLRDYRLKARLYNNRLASALEARFPGCTLAELERRTGISMNTLCGWLTMKVWPHDRRPNKPYWTPAATKLAKVLHLAEDYLFDQDLYGRAPAPVNLELDREALLATGMLALPEATPETAWEADERRAKMREALNTLNPREREVLIRRFGLDGAEETLEEVGTVLAVNRERVRQIEEKALRKLRHPRRAKALREFVAP